ncbi:MAG TPA: hypothetical protein VK982_11495 [Bacteroidales bacterium]|nr:hypothetical protein [Bacteroidales bacterium]
MKIVFDLENQEEKSNSIIKRRTQNLTAIVFTFIFLEALIYDYCATFTSDNFVKKYIDKLDFISKWVLIPKFVSGSQFPTDSQSFEYLQRLKKERNDLMHFKNEYQIFVDNFFKEIRRKL